MEKNYDPALFEQRIYDGWLKKKYFSAKINGKKQPFTIVMPPPNITGQLHIGHAMDCTLQDAIIRYKRMKGYETLWLPGTDHASIATEVKIVEKLKEEGLTKEAIGREEFLRRAFEWKEQYGNRIVFQQYKMGISCDWERSAFTMDERCSKAVKEVFVNLYNKGLIYQGNRIINWCPCCKTAISDAEVDYVESDSKLWYIKYQVENEENYIIIATTRPETMLGDTAVAVAPDDDRYKAFHGKNLKLPLTDRVIPIVVDGYVEKDFGTGAVKITPAHDPNDFEVGLRHSLPIIKIMNDEGTLNELAGKYQGLPREKARIQIVKDLEEQGLLVKIEEHSNNVGHCYRCGTVIEPIVSKQWFVKMKPLAKPAIQVVKDKQTRFLPKRFEKTYYHWMENTQDWCISRQLWWGHRIPVYYCDGCGETIVSKDDIKSCPHCGGKVRQDEDVLDTWFSSALWPFSTMGWPEKTDDLKYFYPTDVLVTGYDIIGFWVSRMIFSGIEHIGQTPFKDVLIHGIVRDAQGRKMSKSLGNGVDPLEIIDNYGADALRYSLVNGISAGGDIKFSQDKLEGYRNFMNKIWNASRFVLMNLEGEAVKDIFEVDLTVADKWILGELSDTIRSVTAFMDKYEIGLAAAEIYDFVWSEFCDWYIELSKPYLYSDDKSKRSATLAVLCYTLREILKLAHPIIPFITAEIYNNLPNKDAEDIMIAPYPDAKFATKKGRRLLLRKSVNEMNIIREIIKSIRVMRSDMKVSQTKRTALFVKPNPAYKKLVEKSLIYIEKLSSGSSIALVEEPPVGKNAAVVTEACEVYIPMGELIDFEKEIERLQKELDTVKAEIARAEGKLKNEGFVKKAPASLIDAEKAKIAKYDEQKLHIEENIAKLQNFNA